MDILLDILLKPPQPLMGLFFHSGKPQHRKNREFGSYFFQTGKTENFAVTQGKYLDFDY